MRAHVNFYSKQVLHILTKNRNTTTSFAHIVLQIMHIIFMTGALSTQQLNSPTVLSLNGAPRKNPRHPEAVPMHKQYQFT